MRLYIAGPITGYPDHNRAAFADAAELYRYLGHDVVNPHDLEHTDVDDWAACMRRDIPVLCTCEGIVLLPGWEQSRGACLEHQIAMSLGMVMIVRESESVEVTS